MRDFLLRRLRRAPVVAAVWDHCERLQAALDEALAERDAALAQRDDGLAESSFDEASAAAPAVYPTPLYVLWAYRLLLGREPEDPQAVARCAGMSRHEVVRTFINSPEFHIRHVLDSIHAPQCSYMVELEGGLRFWLMHGDEFVSPAIAAGRYEPAETAFVHRHVREGMAVLDIGANLGWFTVNLAKIVGGEGRIDAFEPRADVFAHLARTIQENRLTNVALHDYALGRANARGQMVWSPLDTNPGGTNLVSAEFYGTDVRAQPVDVKTLDSCINHRVDFIKMDVEGAEPWVFVGAVRIITRNRPIILLEINPENLVRTAGITASEFAASLERLDYNLHEIALDGSVGARIEAAALRDLATIINVAMLPR